MITLEKSLRVLLDTNVFELLLKEENLDKLEKMVFSGRLIIYGCKVVRDELRDTPRTVKVENKSLRNLLLISYDNLIGHRSYPVGSEIEALAEEYWASYYGGVSKAKIFPDFKIVATATMHRLDIIVSHDEKTMKSTPALEAYKRVNNKKMYPTPSFIELDKL